MQSRARLLLLTAILATGCSKVEESQDGDVLSSLRNAVKDALAPGSAVVWDLVPREYPTEVESVTWSLGDGSSLVVPFYRLAEEKPDPKVALMAHVAADGTVTPLFAADEADAKPFELLSQAPPPQVVPCGREAVVRICGAEDSTVWITDIERGLVRRADVPFADCDSSVMGRALDGDRFVVFAKGSMQSPLSVWSCQGGAIQPPQSVAHLAPAMLSLPNWVEEVEPGVFAWMRHQPGTGGETDFGQWVYERSDGTGSVSADRRALPAPSGFFPERWWERIRREPSGSLLVDGIDGLYRWHVEDDGRVEELSKAPGPEGAEWHNVGFAMALSYRSEPNPQKETLEVPLSYTVHLPSGDGYTSMQVPSTPCDTREQCRWLGESYLRGIVNTDRGMLGLYLLWTWQLGPVPVGLAGGGGADLTVLVMAPLDRPLP